jgi:crotonobetaine/carnitine-CoA ligase
MDSSTDRRTPRPEECVPGELLERWARETPDSPFAIFHDGMRWSYAEALDLVRRTAAGLRALGVQPGELVNVWLPNGPDIVRVWLALNYIGAVYVPLNVSYRGRILEHAIERAQTRMIVVHADLLPRLRDVGLANITDAVVFGESSQPLDGVRLHGAEALLPDRGVDGRPPVAPWQTQMVIYTSGTTGPSKGVEVSYIQNYFSAQAIFGHLGQDDRFLVALPLFHVSGLSGPIITLMRGGSFAMVEAFSASQFWPTVRRTECTTSLLLGVMANFIVSQPPGPRDRDHSLRSVIMTPLSEDAQLFSARFGCDVYTSYNMTETSCPLTSGPNPGPLGTCGRLRPGVEARLVDENDFDVAQGETGELILRTDAPWAMTVGYLNDPEASARAWRNGWFHTGDVFRADADGNYFFVDRRKDAIRRRGENISSFEVETEVCAHPAVKEAAAVAVPSEVGEDEVLVVISLAPGGVLDPAELLEFLAPRMPSYMVPRYVRILPELPKTPTQKVQKHLLRAEGLTVDTFDRAAAGLSGRRETRIGARAPSPTEPASAHTGAQFKERAQ